MVAIAAQCLGYCGWGGVLLVWRRLVCDFIDGVVVNADVAKGWLVVLESEGLEVVQSLGVRCRLVILFWEATLVEGLSIVFGARLLGGVMD